MRKLITVIMVIFIASIVLGGCKKDQESKDKDQVENNTNHSKDQDDPEETSYQHTYPLTGIETNDSIDHRVISVMVNNHPAARPQSGLSQADIVFEILAEGDTTRFLALFHSEQPEVVGPVRSAREYYFELARGYDALYVYHGAADFINDMIINRGIIHLNGASYDNDGKLFKRESLRKAPHNSYLLFPAASDVAEQKGYDMTASINALPFKDETASISGDSAEQVKINYIGKNPNHTVNFTYDQQHEKYQRMEDGQQTTELHSETPIEVENVLILETSHQVIDEEGRRAIDLQSSGRAILIQKGKQQNLEWENRDGKIIPVKDGQPVGFVPGKTWVNVVQSIEQSVEIIGE